MGYIDSDPHDRTPSTFPFVKDPDLIVYQTWQHWDGDYPAGGYVKCNMCGVGHDFMSNDTMTVWKEQHAKPGFFGCKTLRNT